MATPLDVVTSTLVLDGRRRPPAAPAASALSASSSAPAGPAAPADAESAELARQYRGLIRARAIPYPVAYQFVRELGHGRQGVVFQASRHGARGCLTHHAIKLFDPGIYPSAARYWTDMGRIARQVSLLQPINNINLVSCDFYEECNGIGYLHMAAVDGVDLQFLTDGQHLELARRRSTGAEWERFLAVLFHLDDGRLSLRLGAVLHILRNVLRGLAVLHDKGFVHGDIKPTNIMVDAQGTVKLVDFGRAARIGEEVNILLGSPVFMAPEIHRREPGRAASDLFSAGLVGLDLLRGRQVSGLAELNENRLLDLKTGLAAHLESWLPEELFSNIEFIHVLRRVLESDIAHRYADAREAESGDRSLMSARQWLGDLEREAEYERELEAYLAKLADEDTGKLNPHFAAENLTAVIEV